MFHSVYEDHSLTDDIYSVRMNDLKSYLQILKKKNVSFAHFGEEGFNGKHEISLTFDDGFLDNLTLAAPVLFEEKIPFTIFMISDFISPSHKNYLNREHLLELSKNPLVTLGAHGKSHRPLATLSLAEATEELRVSKLELENILGKEVTTMSFPHGSYNLDLLKAARQLGYKKCGTSVPVGNESPNTNINVNRQCIFSCETNLSFTQKINGQWDWVLKNNNIESLA
jgi:peptidoglycan/xylan/chitin deacetylase (PgdA/CDA1 family)